MKDALTLLDLNLLVRNRLRRDFPDTFWVQAEISECKEHYSGHCYLELIQKKEQSDALCAKARATIWSSVWSGLKPRFEQATGARLQAGQKVLLEVVLEFHELYGFSLVIRDIDPTYTVGELSLRRQEVLRRLTADGVIDLNKELEAPIPSKRLAVISSPSAAGYEDFMNQLQHNSYGFAFHVRFFPALMQGEMAAASIVEALNRVLDSGEPFDRVVLIRGGGATTDLQCFDQYDLCFYCAQYPLPLLTGIGHDRDASVLDRVAHTSVKTPTAAAEHLIDALLQQAYRLEANEEKLRQLAQRQLEASRTRLQGATERLRRTVQEGLHRATLSVERAQSELWRHSNRSLLLRRQELELRSATLSHRVHAFLEQQKNTTQVYEARVEGFSPERMIQRGYSLTLFEGKVLRSIRELKPRAVLETQLGDGTVFSEVKQLETNDHDR
jgi:exodeoxyribonuclease VII large subunit